MPAHRTERSKPRARRNNCPFCGRYFPGKSLKTHVETHFEGRRPAEYDPLHICTSPGCDKWFIQRSNLQTHAKIHTGVKDKICPHLIPSKSGSGELKRCVWRSGDPASITRHRREAHGYRPSHQDSVDPWVMEESTEHHGGTLNWDEARAIHPGRRQAKSEANGPRKSQRPRGTPARARNQQSPAAARSGHTFLRPSAAVEALGVPPNPRAIELILRMQESTPDTESVLAQAAGPSEISVIDDDVLQSRLAEAELGSSTRKESPTPESSQAAQLEQQVKSSSELGRDLPFANIKKMWQTSYSFEPGASSLKHNI